MSEKKGGGRIHDKGKNEEEGMRVYEDGKGKKTRGRGRRREERGRIDAEDGEEK